MDLMTDFDALLMVYCLEACMIARSPAATDAQTEPARASIATVDARTPSDGLESRFSTDQSESGDNWSNSSGHNDDLGYTNPSPGKIIGRGAFGSVYKTTWKGQLAALKVSSAAQD